MKTDDLITLLATDRSTETPVGSRTAWILPAALLLSAAVVLAFIGIRSDLVQAYSSPVVMAKCLLPLCLGLLSLPFMLRSSRPEVDVRIGWLWVFVTAAALLFVLGLSLTAPADWLSALRGKTIFACLLLIPALSALPLISLLWVLRTTAPANPARAGALAGLCAGGLATAIYALHCPEDNPLFYVTWYGSAIIITTMAGMVAGRRWLNW